MATIVWPAFAERTKQITDRQKANFDKNDRLIHIENGSAVMCKIPRVARAHKLAPICQCHYIVVRKTEAGNYTLKDEKGELLHRDYVPSELKVVEIDETILEDEVYEVEVIRDHCGNPSNREYLVRWAGHGDRANICEPASSFSQPHITIGNYWKKVKERKEAEAKRKHESMKNTDTDDTAKPRNKRRKTEPAHSTLRRSTRANAKSKKTA